MQGKLRPGNPPVAVKLPICQLIPKAPYRNDESRIGITRIRRGWLDAVSHPAYHSVDAGVKYVTAHLGPDVGRQLIFTDHAPAILVEVPEQIELFYAKRRQEHLAVNENLARSRVNSNGS